MLLRLATLLVLLIAAPASAQRLPAPDWVRSVRITRPGTTVRSGPSTGASRRGTVQVGTRAPFLGRVMGQGCPGGEWIQIGPRAFVCETLVQFSPAPPQGDELPRVEDGSLTPRAHAFVSTDGTWAYARPEDYFRDRWVESLGRGFGLAIVERRNVDGVEMARTITNLWVPVAELRFARPSDFEGLSLDGEALDSVAWIVRERAPLRSSPGGRVVERGSRLVRVTVEEERGEYLRTADGHWVHRRDVARARPTERPDEAGEGERWIDVDTRAQVVTAYVGDRPVWVTAVSTGRGATATPTGSYRIWVKLAEDDMDDLEREDVSENYAIQAVPWVQYFHGSIGFHAAFWHDRFGRPRSHGCVNLSPRDARWLFSFTQPNLPPGWDAIIPGSEGRGTLVRVR